MRATPFGQWAFVHDCSVEPDLQAKVPGLCPSGFFVLPPGFAERLEATGFLYRVNARFDTLLDFYEEEDISSPEVLYFLAGGLQELFVGHDLQAVVGELVTFILQGAERGQCLTFRL